MNFFIGLTKPHYSLNATILSVSIYIILLYGCTDDGLILPEEIQNFVTEEVNAALGDTLLTNEDVQIIIPPNALGTDGTVFLGRTGAEPQVVPNKNLQVIGKPVTLRLPTLILNQPLELTLPLEASLNNQEDFSMFLFNGSTYFPVKFLTQGEHVKIKIDVIDWEKTQGLIPDSFSEVIIMALVNKQTPTNEEKGLKKVTVDNDGNMQYAEPTANQNDKVLLMVHGWLSNSERWIKFIQTMYTRVEQPYTEYWTFSYNSSWSIEHNAQLLYEALELHANSAEIDIVAHSMGGLVSRSMLETHGGDHFVERLVTLGTPHEGSPLAVSRYVIGALVSMESAEEEVIYNYHTQGFKDLDTNSEFILKMKQLTEPPIPYYALACKNSAQLLFAKISSEILEGYDDGVVAVSSALGLRGAQYAPTNVQINTDFAHLEMPNDDLIFEQVMDCLSDGR